MIRTEQAHFLVTANTHPGMRGKNNEDRFAVSAYRLGPNDPTPALLAVLSDGIGGHRAGEVAAEMAVNTISRVVAASDGSHPQAVMQRAVEEASRLIYQESLRSDQFTGMGATCVCVWIIERRLYCNSVGDSRIYLMRQGVIRQISTDHTWIQEALESGLITPDETRGHPNSHVIRRYLGAPLPPQVDFRLRLSERENDSQAEANQGTLLEPGDRLLLCTDGLTDLVSADEILRAFEHGDLQPACSELIELANRRGGHDNITLVAIQVPAILAPPSTPRKRSWPAWTLGCAVLFAIFALVGAVAAGLLWWRGGLPGRQVTPSATLQPGLQQTLFAPTVGGTPGGATAAPQAGTATLSPATVPGGPTLTPWPTRTATPEIGRAHV